MVDSLIKLLRNFIRGGCAAWFYGFYLKRCSPTPTAGIQVDHTLLLVGAMRKSRFGGVAGRFIDISPTAKLFFYR
jgi:hypothetical protein